MDDSTFCKIPFPINNIQVLLWTGKNENTAICSFIDSLTNQEFDKVARVVAQIDNMPHRYRHPEKFKILDGDIWEIKADNIRLACFWSLHDLIVFYGFRKKSQKWPRNDLSNMKGLFVSCKKDVDSKE